MKINSGSLAVGELIGAASFIVAVVAGSMAIVRPFKVARRPFLRDILFFIVAILFGIFVLADGEIHTWECVVMVCYYISYVMFVCIWHWWATRNKRIRMTDAHARDQYLPPGEEEASHIGDDDDGGVGSTEGSGLLGTAPDIRLLESQEDENELEEEEQAVYVELSNNMRVTRSRSDTGQLPPVTPQFIRPSLVGALEFRSVLTSLKKSQNFGGRSIYLRRYSDNPALHSNPLRYSAPGTLMHNTPSASLHESQGYFPTISNPPRPGPNPQRVRAVSVNGLESHTYNHHYTSQLEAANRVSNITLTLPSHSGVHRRETGLKLTVPSQDFLAPPGGPAPDTTASSPASSPASSSVSPSTRLSPIKAGHRPQRSVDSQGSLRFTRSPSIITEGRSSTPPIMNLPEGHSYPPDGDLLRERLIISDADSGQTLSGEAYPKWTRFRYWPYDYLPPPQLITSKLFPTLQEFGDKTLMEKLMALMALPSVFLLAITLPVVEETGPAKAPEPKISRTNGASTPLLLELESPQSAAAFPGMHDSPPETLPGNDIPPGNWNRWLHSLQCIFAPIFVTLVFFDADGTETSDSTIVKHLLYALLVGLISLLLLQIFTSPTQPPKHRHLLCYLGFIVSISWISTIANEVVGVLKTIGVIFNISDAILGLTIFAMGNSLGDLVANITIAKLGFPVMALSACFGGPMLNILLGVGISGMFIGWKRNGEGYKVEVSPMLAVSAATLLITLVFLLVSVPANGWKMSRRIGWVMVGLWSVGTVVNLCVEVRGIGSKVWGNS
ncbi:Sodium/calcium exchanger protein-domain-containing protein [Terfezia claveryi]|nr:Sodium/calcium exchanger protein-domain-containing protein [Terfezia claveryi]